MNDTYKKNLKIIQINTVCNGSTGKIMANIQTLADDNGYNTLSLYGRRNGYSNLKCYKIGNNISFIFHVLFTFIFNNEGCYSVLSTKKLIKLLRQENPDIIQLHNIHGYYLNYKMLFNFLNEEYTGNVFWTFHDCWPITGHCAYFDYVKCDKWKQKCGNCPQIHNYPISLFFDTSSFEFENKKELFQNTKNLTIITPSIWLKRIIYKSFLKDKDIVVINNGIDLNVFKKIVDLNVYKKYNIDNSKKILLGVASIWEKRKGYEDILILSKNVSKNVIIIMIGLSKKQMKNLPDNIIGIERTENQLDLVKLYSVADIFINPTHEDNFPTVNLEAIACGTPVISYDTGGCAEQINCHVGIVCKNLNDMLISINKFLEIDFKKNIFDNKKILKKIDSKTCFKKYIELYRSKIK